MYSVSALVFEGVLSVGVETVVTRLSVTRTVYCTKACFFSFHRYMCALSEFERQLQKLRTTNYTHDLAVGGLWSKLKYLDTAR